jgi:hypothetical protein
MDRRVFLESSAAAVVAVALGEFSAKPKPFSHFDLLVDHGGYCRLRCKHCKGEFWVDACTEENLRIFENRLVPECEHCKLHDGYGMPLVTHEWGRQTSHSGSFGAANGPVCTWADEIINGYVGSRWGTWRFAESFMSEPAFQILQFKREVFLPKHLSTVFPHTRGKYIKAFNNRFAYGWGKVILIKEVHFAPKATPVFYSFRPTPETMSNPESLGTGWIQWSDS